MVTRRDFIAGSAATLAAGATSQQILAGTTAAAPSSGKAPTFKLSDGKSIPAVGLGTSKSPPEEVAQAVRIAIQSGYRLIDTAARYGNEKEIGEGLASSGVAREALFVTTKLWPTDFGYEQALAAFDTSLKKLGLDYLDLYLLHWPAPAKWDKTLAAWRALEKLQAEGSIRSIGVSNFLPDHLDKLLKEAKVEPVLNQVELNPLFAQPEQRQADKKYGIITEAWSPIGGSRGAVSLLKLPEITQIAAELGKSPAQVVLRWHFQNGVVAIPKSTHAERIKANIDIFNFELSAAQVQKIDALDTGKRAGFDPQEYTG